MPKTTEKKVAIVTGSSSGIGRAIAELLATRGYQVFGFSRRSVSAGFTSIQVDVRDDDSVRQGVEQVLSRAGRIDALVNAAGYSIVGAVEESSSAQTQALFNTNVFGTIRVTRAVLPAMRAARSGRVINIGSVVGFLPAPFMGIYSATKHAIEGYTESLDHEIRNFGVRAIVIEPGFTRTEIGNASERADSLIDQYSQASAAGYRLIGDSIEKGMPASAVAQVTVAAIENPKPKLRYPVASQDRLLSRLRRWMPAGVFDKSLRKQFQLDLS